MPFRGDSPVAVAMKHVREELPDVQERRPQISAATAAVVDRATAKDLAERYPDAASMAAELEEALAVEAARSGQATGEVTTVLRSLPRRTRRRLPWRMRHPARWVLLLGATAAIVAVGLWLAAGETHRGTGVPAGADRNGLQPVPLSETAANSYNPFGTGPENRDQVQNLVDNDPNTTWRTEQYYEGTLRKAGGTGSGVYLDAAPRVQARAVELLTPTPGFAVQVYVADHIAQLPYGSSVALAARGWHGPVGASPGVDGRERIPIAVPRAYRYYLVWLTSLPPGSQSATIAGITLLR